MVIAGVFSLLALAVVVSSLVWLHVQPTGLSPIRNAVSEYGITPFRAGYRIATIAFGLAGLGLAIGIDRSISGHGEIVVVALLIVFALARAAISWSPMDAPGQPRTSTGVIHVLLAFVAFATVTAAALTLGGVLGHVTRWHSLGPASTGLGYAMTACLFAFGASWSVPPLRARPGLIERGFYVFAIAWVAVFAFACAADLN